MGFRQILPGLWPERQTMSYQQFLKNRPKQTIVRGLLFWFLLIALLPLLVISVSGYNYFFDSLIGSSKHNLEQGSKPKAQFIKNWFDYRLMDLHSLAENQNNTDFLLKLVQEFRKSGENLEKFVASSRWSLLVDKHQQELVTFSRAYDYVYDVFLIDKDGNILFSVARESDLGTNLLVGIYADTYFATAVKSTLTTGKTLFSDVERYSPSADRLSGFLSSPMLAESGEKIGAIVVQLRMGRIIELMGDSDTKSPIRHYLVGEDRLLLTPIDSDKPDDVLNRYIGTEIIKIWKQEQDEGVGHSGRENFAIDYIGPDGVRVVGLHQEVVLPGVNWVLISEIDYEDVLSSVTDAANLIVIFLLITAGVVALLAVYLAKRLSQPIVQLANAALKVAGGNAVQKVTVDSDNELGELASAFNYMMVVRNQHEDELSASNREAKKALAALADQKFAIDQHAIVAATDVKGNITFTNKKFSDISGYSQEELLGQNHRLLNSGYHDKEFFRNMYLTVSKGNVWQGDIHNKAKDGHLYWVDTTIVPFMDVNGKPESYIAIRNDITERKRIEAVQRELHESTKAKFQLRYCRSPHH